MNFKRVLFLGAHPDDEFGCSGALSKFIEEGREIYYAVFSFCEESVPPEFPKDILKYELNKALSVIGIKENNVFRYNFKVRHFPTYRQDILEEMILLKKRIDPDLILLPALSDIHQDHNTIATEGVRAFKQCTIFGYELPQNSIAFKHACFITLEKRHLSKKIESLLCYRSQSHHPYTNEEFIMGMAKIRGVQIGHDLAEAFEVIRLKI